MEQPTYEKRGYLRENYRLFHLSGALEETVDWHYHTFHKIIVFLSDGAGYGVEGRSYAPQAGDLMLVASGCIHRPEPRENAPYERMILYISPEFIRARSTPECDLESCFTAAREEFRFLVRLGGAGRELLQTLRALEHEAVSEQFGSALLSDALFFRFLIGVCRGMREHRLEFVASSACDEKVTAILEYLSLHLTQEITIDALASHFYISKYHMMRRFREETGYTIHNYLATKRLMLAREKIASGMPVSEACYQCGFREYSTFARAYKKLFSEPPRSAR